MYLLEWLKQIFKRYNTACWPGCRAAGTPLRCWWECKMARWLWKPVWQFLKKLNTNLPYNPANPTPRYLPKKNEGLYLSKNCMRVSFCGFTHHCPKLGTTPIPLTGRWTDKLGLSSSRWNAHQQWKDQHVCSHTHDLRYFVLSTGSLRCVH